MDENKQYKFTIALTPSEIRWIIKSLVIVADDLEMQVQYEKAESNDSLIAMQEQIDALWKENEKLKAACKDE